MAELDLIELIVFLLPIAALLLGGVGSALYYALKLLLQDFVKAIDNDVITKDELEILLKDGLGVIAAFKRLFRLK